MIIFDLDGTLADCEHRRHFVDPSKNKDYLQCYADMKYYKKKTDQEFMKSLKKGELIEFKPDWKSFYEACDKDTPIYETIEVFKMLLHCNAPIQIWSGRCESVREKTELWLYENSGYLSHIPLKMRPIGDYTSDDQLKETWLDEELWQGKKIDFVFDDRKKVIDMWRRRGIFVFDVSQGKGEF